MRFLSENFAVFTVDSHPFYSHSDDVGVILLLEGVENEVSVDIELRSRGKSHSYKALSYFYKINKGLKVDFRY